MAKTLVLEDFIEDVVADSWSLVKKDPTTYLLAGLILLVVSTLTLGLMMEPLMFGFIRIVRRRRLGEELSAATMFEGLTHWGRGSWALGPVFTLSFVAGSLSFFLPTIAFTWVAMFAFHEAAYYGRGVVESIRGSWVLIRANPVLTLVFYFGIAVLIGGGAAVVLGLFVAVPFVLVMITFAYERLIGAPPEEQTAQP